MTEHTHGKEVLRPLAVEGRALRQMIPDVYAGFAELNKAAMAPSNPPQPSGPR